MNSNGINQLPDTSCPDAATLVRYIKGEMSPAEQHQLEKHTIDCPFCEEALEGLGEMHSPGNLPGIQAELNEKIHQRVIAGKEARIIHLPAFRIAATITILLISGITLWYFFPGQKPEKLFTQEYKPFPAPQPVIVSEPSIQVANEEIKKGNSGSKSTNIKSVPPTTTESIQTVVSMTRDADDETTNPVVAAAPVEANKQFDDQLAEGTTDKNSQSKDEDYSAAPAALSKKQENTNTKVLEEKATEKYKADSRKESTAKVAASGVNEEADRFSVAAKADPFEQGMTFYREARYAEALPFFLQSSDQKESSFYAGQCYLSLDRPAEAISSLKHYVKLTGIRNAEAGWWYLALAHLKNNESNDARASLKKVIEFHGGFQQRAEELLRKI